MRQAAVDRTICNLNQTSSDDRIGLQNFGKWDLAQALDYESYVLEVCKSSEDFMEGFSSFLEKREPVFKGR